MLKEQMLTDLKEAMQQKDKLRKDVITNLRSDLLAEEKNQQVKALDEDAELVIVKREMKKTKEALEMAEKANRPELVEKEKKKITIIEAYLPKQMTEDEIKELLISMNVDKGANKGQVMGQVMGKVKNNAEGKTVSKAVEDYLNS